MYHLNEKLITEFFKLKDCQQDGSIIELALKSPLDRVEREESDWKLAFLLSFIMHSLDTSKPSYRPCFVSSTVAVCLPLVLKWFRSFVTPCYLENSECSFDCIHCSHFYFCLQSLSNQPFFYLLLKYLNIYLPNDQKKNV